MTRKISFLLPFCIFVALSNVAYSAENYASEEYVDDLFFEVIDYVDSTTTPMNRTMKTNDNQLFENQVVLRDMLNARDADDNWIQLDTEAKLAIPAINELHSEMAGKQDVITAENPLAVENISGLSEVATTGSYNSLSDKPEIPSVDGLAEKSYVDEELAKKVSAETIQNLEQNITNNYLTKTDAQNTYLTQETASETYVTEQQVTQQITNVVGSADSGLLKDVADNKAAIATKADKSALETAVADLDAKIDQAVIDSSNIDLSSYAKTEDVAKTYATIGTVDAVEGRVDTIEAAGYQTAGDVQGAITTATKDLATKSELAGYVLADSLGALATKDSVSTDEIQAKAVTMDKIAGREPVAGETLLMSVDAEGNVTWLSVEILK
ncbi:MAG: hypothetical protein J6R52_03375 [Alphaproteobacteria bacterium]|nr:hypothetical protein [Alphaproteobacteria bacterium]